MLFAIHGTDADASLDRRLAVRAEHLARVRELLEQGRLVLAGPFPAIPTSEPGPAGYTGSLIVAEFPSLAAAEAWAAEDPYLAAGAWLRVEVRPFVQVLP
jgi:uncharacterized protein YciI